MRQFVPDYDRQEAHRIGEAMRNVGRFGAAEYEWPRPALLKGIPARADGRGHPWANAHRVMLPPRYTLTDFDAIESVTESGADLVEGEDTFFGEYACGRAGTEFIAFFDMKKQRADVQTAAAKHRSRVYVDLCEKVGNGQVIRPKFFFVYGGAPDEWDIEEVDPITRQRSGKLFHLDRLYPWEEVWKELGLIDLRQRAEEQIRRQGSK